MPSFSIRQFAGMRPVSNPDLLQPGEAELAVNCRLVGGDIEPWRGLRAVATLSDGTVRTIYRFGQSSSSESQYWFQWTTDVDVVKGPTFGDTQERTYWTGDGYPKKTDALMATGAPPYPTASYRLGIPAPAQAPTVTVNGSPTSPDDPANSVVYVATYVTAWGEESAPSPASGIATYQPGQTPRVSNLPAALDGSYNVTKVRLYRSNVGSAASQFQFLAEVNLGTAFFDDTVAADALGGVLPTTGWLPPPDTLKGLCLMANGIMAGFDGSEVFFSEPNVPYAWPVRYRQAVDAPVLGIKPFGQSLFVSTARSAFVFTGVDPSQMTQEKLDTSAVCVSKRSMVEMLGGVVYAAKDGLRFIGPGGADVLTKEIMSPLDWAAYNPESMSCYNADGRCLVFFDTGSRQGGLCFTFGPNANMTELDFYATAGFYESRALYLVVGNQVMRWDDGATNMTATWRSGPARLPLPVNFTCAQVDAGSYPVVFKLYADGVLKHTQSVASPDPFRLPGGYRARRYQLEVSSTGVVKAAAVATSVAELKEV